MFLIVVLICGCSVTKKPAQKFPTNNTPPSFKNLEDNYWWKCSFKIVWPDEEKIDWGVDALLAHAVISPLLLDQTDDILYWRFHRRAARDSAGHQFSFLFYSSPEIASSVFSGIGQSEILKETVGANIVEKVVIDDPNASQSPNIEDASDQNWSPALQKNWPSFIMGVSSLWLGLIDEAMKDPSETYADVNSLLERYREIDINVSNTWRTEGQHALLHHLNAVFGYDPLYIRKLITF